MRPDPRQIRTRQALVAALTRLLERRPLDEITVAELCREAGVHRTTFYGHADGVPEFALAEFSRDIDRIAEVDVEPTAEAPEEVADRYLSSMRRILDHIAEERAGYRTLFGPVTRGIFRTAVDDRLRHRARLALEVWREQRVPGAPRTEEAIEQAAAYVAGGLVGAIETWALSDETDASAEAARIATLMPAWWPRRGTQR
ncbi:TetR/AcrR family transcriptional regulator [Agromyces silvae]|uniref:TetR/AcrR family transcriptional regulator n=1 Tax=Agromyces silvae TaxID=3388266 RepID=UPI00280B3FFD|nr:TetR/AcrR family transcriptional regulator C-terminal domain-containing protein [Agromyces protaetiae]